MIKVEEEGVCACALRVIQFVWRLVISDSLRSGESVKLF
jgi:hypothetical protein